jgi:hypothetical protein
MRGAYVLLIPVLALAPSVRAEVRLGVSGGVGLSKLTVDEPEEGASLEWRTAPAAGLVLDMDLGPRFGLSLQPSYVEQGSDVFIEAQGFLFDEDVHASFVGRGFEVALLARFYLGRGRTRPYLCAGAVFSHVFSWRLQGTGSDGEEVDEDADDFFEKDDVGISAGAGVEFERGRVRFFLESRYAWGLLQLAREREPEDSALHSRGIRALAGVTFRLGGS